MSVSLEAETSKLGLIRSATDQAVSEIKTHQ
jgi:hypothetical protein